MLERKKQAEQQAREDVARIKTFIAEWDELAQLLHADPIMDRSGQIEEKPVPRTFADRQNEIASKLTNPKEKYAARCKLADGSEHIIKPDEIETHRPADSPSVVQARLDRIREQTRLNYCQKRDDVAAAIAARQMVLTEPLKKQQRVRTEE